MVKTYPPLATHTPLPTELSLFFIIPQFILTIDWGRWIIAFLFNLFYLILYLNYKQEGVVVKALEELSDYIMRHKFLFVLLLFYMTSFGKIQAAAITNDFSRITDFFKNIKAW